MFRIFSTLLLVGILFTGCADDRPDFAPFAAVTSDDINLNQLGCLPGTTLRFSVITHSVIRDTTDKDVPDTLPSAFYLTNPAGDRQYQKGELGPEKDWTSVGGVRARYTEIPAPARGEYRLYVPGVGYSHTFAVSDDLYKQAFVASVKSNYFQRASTELLPEHAGEYARPAGHPDTAALYHPSSGRSSGKLASPGGWYDAGDFNKYIVNAAFPLGQYLSLYADAGDPLPDGSLNIPESGNGKSDYLDELKYELDWTLTMQDTDGGLFHKLTTLGFAGMVMPHEATEQRYVVGKSTTATLDFAAAAAQASRVYRGYDSAYADRLLTAAGRAWAWAEDHPEAYYTNPADVSTGQYGDSNTNDEATFAAAELYLATGEEKYFRFLQDNPPYVRYREGESWTGFMAALGVFSLLREGEDMPQRYRNNLRGEVLAVADSLVAVLDTSAYHQPVNRFVWGSTSDVLNAALYLLAAYDQEAKPEYLEGVRACVDYVFGHNPLGVSFLTGYGDKTPQFIHHRASLADGITEPVPGLLSGGPNSGRQDRKDTTYPRYAAPMQSWADQGPSYASNEICLNWNAPLTYVLGRLVALE